MEWWHYKKGLGKSTKLSTRPPKQEITSFALVLENCKIGCGEEKKYNNEYRIENPSNKFGFGKKVHNW